MDVCYFSHFFWYESKKYGGTSKSTSQGSHRHWRFDEENNISNEKGKDNNHERDEVQSKENGGEDFVFSSVESQNVESLAKEREDFPSKHACDQNLACQLFPSISTHDIVANGAKEYIPFIVDLELQGKKTFLKH